MGFSRASILGSFGLALALPFAPSSAQDGPGVHRSEVGGYTVIYSAVRSDALPEIMAREHGIPASEDAALLNVTLEQSGENLSAQSITATATNLAEQLREIEMKETVANNFVSYLGVVEIAEREVLDFEIEVVPEGASQPIVIRFREEFLPEPRAGLTQ